MPSKPLFLHDHFAIHHSDFSSLLAVFTTEKPVNWSIHAYALTWLNVFALRGFIFRDIHKKTREFEQFGLKIQKICGRKIYSRTRTFGAEVHKSNIRVKRWHNKYENSELDWKTQLCLNDLLTESNRAELQTYKLEERTFGTPCIFGVYGFVSFTVSCSAPERTTIYCVLVVFQLRCTCFQDWASGNEDL